MNQIQNKYIILGSLCALLLTLVVGYAAFSTVLKIKGTSNINSNWDIQITNIEKIESKGSIDVEGTPKYESLTATFNTNFTTPGDYATYKIEITNNGSLDAILKNITMPENTNNDIIFYLNKDKNNEDINDALKQNDTLFKKGETGNVGYVYVTVLYRDYENQQTPTKDEDKTASMTITFDFEQADGSGGTPDDNTINMKGIDVDIVSENDGLYVDEYETGRYLYKGANPNNYITFNDESWRIISLENDGTLKIMKNSSIGDMVWYGDYTYTGEEKFNWNESSLYNYLNGTYYNNLKPVAQNQIVLGTFYTGEVKNSEKDLSVLLMDEKTKPQSSKVALPTASEYVRASINPECKSIYNYSFSDENKKCYYNASTHNWMFNLTKTSTKKSFWTLNKAYRSYMIMFVCGFEIPADGDGFLETTGSLENDSVNNSQKGVIPALYLKSDITLSGEGTESSPYTIN